MSKKTTATSSSANTSIPASLRSRVNQLAARRGNVPAASLAEAFTAVEAAGGRISIYALPTE